MGSSVRLISDNIINSLAPSTWEGYSSAWNEWCDFCRYFNFNVLNPNITNILSFISSLMSRNLSATSISKTLAGISFFQKLNGFPAINSHFLVTQSLKGYRKLFPDRDSRRPITLNILEKLFYAVPLVCSSPFESLLFQASFVLAFFGALRISEFTAPNKISSSPLHISDVFLGRDFIKIFIPRSKSDQIGHGIWIRLNSFEAQFCPVKVISKYLSARPFSLGDFFIHADNSVLTKFQFNFVLKKSLEYLGLDNLRITSHSFRIGAATEAARFGLHESIIRRLGRWESDRFRLYVRPNLVVNV